MFGGYKGGFRLTDNITFLECPTYVSIWTLRFDQYVSDI